MIQQLPSIWDHIASGISGGQQAYNQQTAINTEKDNRSLQQMLGLIESGQVDPTQLQGNPLIQKLLGGAQLQPNASLVKNKIASGASSTDSMSTGQLAAMGMPGQGALAKDTAQAQVINGPPSASRSTMIGAMTPGQIASDQALATTSNIHTRAMQGDATLTDDERQSAGLDTVGEMQARAAKAFDANIENKAANYVDQVIAQNGGRIDSKLIARTGEIAFQQYKADLAKSRTGQMDAQQESSARAFFHKQVLDRAHQQRMADISAVSASHNGSMSEEDRIYAMLESSKATEKNLMIQAQTAMTQAIGNNPMLESVITKAMGKDGKLDMTKVIPSLQGQAQIYMNARQQLEDAMNRIKKYDKAQTISLLGGNRAAIGKLLNDTTALTGGATTPPPNTGTTPPPATGTTPPPTASAAAKLTSEERSSAVNYMLGLDAAGRQSYLDSYKGKLDPQDYEVLKRRFNLR